MGPPCEQVELTTVVLHKLKCMACFEKSVEKNAEFGPNAAHGCHPESQRLILEPHSQNAALRNLRKLSKMDRKVSC